MKHQPYHPALDIDLERNDEAFANYRDTRHILPPIEPMKYKIDELKHIIEGQRLTILLLSILCAVFSWILSHTP